MPKVLPRLLRLAVRHPVLGGVTILASLGSAVANLTLPRLLGRGVDAASRLLKGGAGQADAAGHALLAVAALVIAASVTRGLLTGFGGYVAEKLSQQVAYGLRLAYFQQLQRLSFGFHDRIHSGDLITRGMLDLEGARAFVQTALTQATTLLVLLVAATAMMVAADPWLALLGLSFVPIAGWALARMGFLLRVTWLKVQQLQSVLTLTMEESLQGTRVVRAFSAKPFEIAKYDAAAVEVLEYSFRRATLRSRAVAAMNLSFYIAMTLLIWVGGRKVAHHRMTVGALTEFLTYMTLLQAPIRQIAMIVASAARATSSGARLFEVLDLEPEIADAPGARPLQPTEGVLRFEHVAFAYEPDRPVLRDVSFELRPGRTLGIVGPPGSGKSTIAQLVPRFYDVTGGRITIDGVDIREATLASLRQYVGLVQQDAFLFDTTAANNVAYADPWAEEARIVGAAQTAQIHDYLAGLPAAYETRVGERGVALSGGQRQRMSIARGVTPTPGVMIFDDSTAAIDAVTERRVREALAQATAARSTLIIAHRLSSLMHADEILVLDEGAVVERGTTPSWSPAAGPTPRSTRCRPASSRAG